MVSEIEEFKKSKATTLEQFRAALDKKAVDSKKSLKEMEGKKVVESKVVKLVLWKKTDEAKKKFEKLEKSKECKVKKEKMTVSLLSESKKELESHSSLARIEACNQKSRS